MEPSLPYVCQVIAKLELHFGVKHAKVVLVLLQVANLIRQCGDDLVEVFVDERVVYLDDLVAYAFDRVEHEIVTKVARKVACPFVQQIDELLEAFVDYWLFGKFIRQLQ